MLWALLALILAACGGTPPAVEPLLAEPAAVVVQDAAVVQNGIAAGSPSPLPPTFTPDPATLVAAEAASAPSGGLSNQQPATATQIIPTNTPVTPTATPLPTETPTLTATLALDAPGATSTSLPIKPFDQYGFEEAMPYQAFPRPVNDNGWGMHWIPTVKQDAGTIDRFVTELARMHIKWVVFLNEGGNIGDNDYLVERLVANGMMPVMRIYQSTLEPYGGDIGAMVAHYRARGVYYYQLYNEPNVNLENTQGFANPNRYALAWATTARQVVNNGGLPGIGALSPGGAYDHYDFLERTLRAIRFNGDENLLNHAWVSLHNYHGLRPQDDPDGFWMYRRYDRIVRDVLGRSLPIIGTEGGSYSPDTAVQTQQLSWQYRAMQTAEPYYFAFTYWLLANQAGGSGDDTWEWQALFKGDESVHPVVGAFFYVNDS